MPEHRSQTFKATLYSEALTYAQPASDKLGNNNLLVLECRKRFFIIIDSMIFIWAGDLPAETGLLALSVSMQTWEGGCFVYSEIHPMPSIFSCWT